MMYLLCTDIRNTG